MKEDQFYLFKKLLDNYKSVPWNSSSSIHEFDEMDVNKVSLGDIIWGKAWLSSYVFTGSQRCYTPFRPVFKTGVENQGVSGISWLFNYMPVSKINLTMGNFKLAFLYPYKSSGFNIKLSYNGIAVENYNEYMSLMYSKEICTPENFLLEDDNFKPMPVLIPKETETENIVSFKGNLCFFHIDSKEIITLLDKTSLINYKKFVKEAEKPLCISIASKKAHIESLIFKDFKNSKYNVKYGSITKEYQLKADIKLPGFIPDIPHALCENIGNLDYTYKSPAFSSTPNYGINKIKAISSSCGPVLFNYAQGNIISLSVFCNLNDKKQKLKVEKYLSDFFILLKSQLEKYMKDNFKCHIELSNKEAVVK